MKICVAPRFCARSALPPCDVALFGFDSLGDVDFESELSGKSDKLGEFARLTKKYSCAAVCGCRTLSRGLKRKSAAVAEGGKLLGISDMLHVADGEEYKSGAYLGLYKLGGYKVGLCIENDINFPEAVKSLSLCGCNLLLYLAEGPPSPMQPLLARAYAYLYGMPVAVCAGGYSYLADISGRIAGSPSPAAVYSVLPRNNYRVVTTRERGAYSPESGDY